jgi:hypothetical protein
MTCMAIKWNNSRMKRRIREISCTETEWKEWEIKQRKRHDMHGNQMKVL